MFKTFLTLAYFQPSLFSLHAWLIVRLCVKIQVRTKFHCFCDIVQNHHILWFFSLTLSFSKLKDSFFCPQKFYSFRTTDVLTVCVFILLVDKPYKNRNLRISLSWNYLELLCWLFLPLSVKFSYFFPPIFQLYTFPPFGKKVPQLHLLMLLWSLYFAIIL